MLKCNKCGNEPKRQVSSSFIWKNDRCGAENCDGVYKTIPEGDARFASGLSLSYHELVVALSLMIASKYFTGLTGQSLSIVAAYVTFKGVIIGERFSDAYATNIMYDVDRNYRLADSKVYRREDDRIFMITADGSEELTSEAVEKLSPFHQLVIAEVTKSFK